MTNKIPTLPFITLTIIEPLMSLNGVRIALTNPNLLIHTYLTRGAVSYVPETQTLYTQLAGFWLLFAYLEFFVLRPRRDDLWLWKRVCFGFLVSDVVYFWAAAQGVGGWGTWVDVSEWTGDEWTVSLGALWPGVMRGVVVFGL
ncbi:hypothetical protein QBC47DRAFT_402016 [Echria macrotheca]|uniref:DUF7704 domain-containing protein n=1 Tax=Echria macrotheca TaxID=438768 RepID=A0AAJ0BEL1_9PEZI|nr:hypothetical protein QBC47DRAFT_402016 [Echria macrotheca]